jgi:DNA-binding protein H-NS
LICVCHFGQLVHDLNCLSELEKLGITTPLTTEEISATLESLSKKKVELLKDKEEKKAKSLAAIAEATAAISKKKEQKSKEGETATEPAAAVTTTDSAAVEATA